MIAFQSIESAKAHLIESANRINTERFTWSLALGWFSPDGLSRARRLEILAYLGDGDRNPVSYGPDGPRTHPFLSSNEAEKRGELFCSVAGAVATAEPFPAEGSQLKLDTEAAVLAWLPELEDTARRLQWGIADREWLGDEAAAADRAKEKELSGLLDEAGFHPEDPTVRRTYETHRAALRHFVTFVETASRIASETRVAANQLDRLRGRLLPTRPVYILAAGLLLTVFVCGVGIPMVAPTVSTIVAAWIPVAIYVAAIVGCSVYFWGRVR